MGVLHLTAWCLDPAVIPREVDLHVVEPDEPPSLADMAASSMAVVPPHINTLVYPLLVHVTRTIDFRRDTPGGAASGDSDGGRTAGWTKRRQYQYTRGVPDVLPGGIGGGGAAPSGGQAGGSRVGSTKTLASGAVVEFDRSMLLAGKGKRRRRACRKVQALRAKALAAVQSAGLVDGGGAVVPHLWMLLAQVWMVPVGLLTAPRHWTLPAPRRWSRMGTWWSARSKWWTRARQWMRRTWERSSALDPS
jgi:hypothetical protein